MRGKRWRSLAAGMVVLIAAAAPGPSPLAKVQPGQWLLKEVGTTSGRSLCVADPAAVLQLGHGEARCTRTVIDSSATALTVRYSCAGAGQGRSTLTLRTPTAFRLQTQGLAGGAPFEFDYEAHRTGDCGAPR